MEMNAKQKYLLGFNMEKGGLLSCDHQSFFWLFGASLANFYLLSLANAGKLEETYGLVSQKLQIASSKNCSAIKNTICTFRLKMFAQGGLFIK